MKQVTLGSTGITVNKNGFGALPIQRVSREEAKALLLRAYEAGVRFFDTARFYTDSESKIGYALGHVRNEIYIATKSMALTGEEFKNQLNKSLEELGTDYVDLMQFHNPPFCPLPGQENGLYEAMMEVKAQGKVRHIGITNHRIHVAREAVKSGLYEVLQYPFSYIASQEEIDLVNSCKERNMGFLSMKGMAGGLLSSGRAAYAFQSQFDHVLPIWGVQRMEELEEFLSCNTEDFQQEMTEEMEAIIRRDRQELMGDFCRACGYCMPCPQDIYIPDCARMELMLKRAPIEAYTTELTKERMRKIEDCVECGLCKSRCPYGLDIPKLLKENLEYYRPFF